MGSISNVPNGTAYLKPLADSVTADPLSPSVGKIPQSVSPKDAVEISPNALQLQKTNGLFGLPATPPAAPPVAPLPDGAIASQVNSATPSAQVQNLFYPPLATPNTTNLLA